jgi:prepilin-type N-terminal cleavage/methylation domain-containing protein
MNAHGPRRSRAFERTRPRAFTLVELLVVIAIIGVLVALLLPAIQAAREASRRSQCLNNLRQIAIGCHNFQTANGAFPTAGGAVEQFFNPAELSKPAYGYEGASWMYQILPFIEQQVLYNLRRGDGGANAGFVQTGLCEEPVPIFNCPSRNGRFVVHATDIYQLGDYAGVLSISQDSAWQGFEWQTSRPPRANEEELVWTGILVKGGQVNRTSTPAQIWKFAKVDFKAIEDGSSNTILIAEKAVPTQFYTLPSSSPWPYWELYGYYTGADWPVMRAFGLKNNPADEETALKADSDARVNSAVPTREHGFGSPHPSVLCTVWGDGSTRAISMAADPTLLHRVGARSDQSSVTANDLL